MLKLPHCFLPVFFEGSFPLADGCRGCSGSVLMLFIVFEWPSCSKCLDSSYCLTLYSSCSVFIISCSLVLFFMWQLLQLLVCGENLETVADRDGATKEASHRPRISVQCVPTSLNSVKLWLSQADPACNDTTEPGTKTGWEVGLDWTI